MYNLCVFSKKCCQSENPVFFRISPSLRQIRTSRVFLTKGRHLFTQNYFILDFRFVLQNTHVTISSVIYVVNLESWYKDVWIIVQNLKESGLMYWSRSFGFSISTQDKLCVPFQRETSFYTKLFISWIFILFYKTLMYRFLQ